jgi:hypothetical protein
MAIILSIATLSRAMDVTIQWQANTEPDLAGYRLYQADRIGDHTGAWVQITEVGLVTTCTVTVADNQNFAWLLTAYDTSDNESFVSNMVELFDRTSPHSPINLSK